MSTTLTIERRRTWRPESTHAPERFASIYLLRSAWPATADLSGFTGVRRVEILECTSPELAPLSTLSSLEELFVLDCPGTLGLGPVGELEGLVELVISMSPDQAGALSHVAWNRLGKLSRLSLVVEHADEHGATGCDLGFLDELPNLDDLQLAGLVAADRSTTVLEAIGPRLSALDFTATDDGQYDRLRRLLPGTAIVPPVVVQAEPPPRIFQDGGAFQAYEDIAAVFGTETTRDALPRLRALLQERAPHLLERVEVDPEADGVGFYAGHRTDLEELLSMLDRAPGRGR